MYYVKFFYPLIKLAHIINPVKVNQNSDLFFAQPITFESMLRAKENNDQNKNIKLYSVQFEEDKEIIPTGFEVLPNLEKSVLDVNSNLKKRKLPLIKDILKSLQNASDADYYIFTNVDIGLMPSFYNKVFEYIEQGHDAVIINRRRLKAVYTSVEHLENIYKDKGKSHPGFDCFVFHKSLLDKFILDEICVGVPFLGVSLAYNTFSFSKKPLYVFNKYLTFHIGEAVLPKRKNAFYKHNFNTFFNKIKPKLVSEFKLENFPYSDRYWLVRFFKFALNPSLSVNDFLALKFPKSFNLKKELVKKNYNKIDRFFKIRTILNELRWRFLEK